MSVRSNFHPRKRQTDGTADTTPQPDVPSHPLFHGQEIGVRFSSLFPDVRFTEAELDSAFGSARLLRVLSGDIADKFRFRFVDLCEFEASDLEPEVTGKPVRGVLSRRAVTHKGWFFSHCADCIIPWESSPELGALTRLDCLLGVTFLCTQPLALEYLCPVTGRRRLAYPDIYFERSGMPMLLEIKRKFSRLKPDDIRRLVLLEKLFERAGVPYRGWDEQGICEEPAFGNADWLARYKSISLDHADRVSLLQVFATESCMPLSQLSALLADRHQMRSFAMILHGWLIAEGDVSLRDDPVVTLSAALKGGRDEGSC